MRRSGFTMLEVTAALVVVTGMLLLGMVLGKRYIQAEREQVFLDQIETEWSSLQSRSRMNLSSAVVLFIGGSRVVHFEEKYRYGWRAHEVPMPATFLTLPKTPSTRVEQTSGGKMFAQPKTLRFNSTLGYHYEFTFEMGWGRLVIKKVAGMVE